MPAAYQDGRSVPRGGRHPSSLPNPRWISQKNHPDSDIPDPRYTHMVMQFGQFLDHDITLTPKDGKLYIRILSLNFKYDAVTKRKIMKEIKISYLHSTTLMLFQLKTK